MESRRRGDTARDARNWSDAAHHYAAYLDSRSEDAAIWIQLGHVLKESGDFRRAEEAYNRAKDITPDDADLLLQIGHLFNRTGRPETAALYYKESSLLSPSGGGEEALRSVRHKALIQTLTADITVARSNRHLIQINDFLMYLQHHKTVSGIQRVQLGVINHVLRLPDELRDRPAFVYCPLRSTTLRVLGYESVRAVAEYVAGCDVDHDRLRALIAEAIETSVPVTLRKGDVFFILGAFWGLGGCADLLRLMKTNGVKSGILFYDIIPVTHPEFCEDSLSADFLEALEEALCFVDFGLAISEHTADEIRRFVQSYDLAPVPMAAIPLAHRLQANLPKHDAAGDAWPESLAELKGRRYVLCVGTIEARKNHRYLFDAWKALSAERADLPDLVLVGRHGWRVDDLFAQFKATNYLGGRIKVLHDLSDVELAALYEGCLFTVFPSIVEGWGLPIGESLSYGKVCVASNTSSMPEVGGEFVEYIDPWNLRAGLDVFRRLIADEDGLRAREADIRARFRPRDWEAVARDFIDTLGKLADGLSVDDRAALVPGLRTGEIFVPRRIQDTVVPVGTDLHQSRLRQLILHDRWNRPEHFGTWLDGPLGAITFRTDVRAEHDVVVYLRVTTTPWINGHSLSVHDSDSRLAEVDLGPSDTVLMRVKTRTDADSQVKLTIRIHGRLVAREDDTRLLSAGVTGLAYAAADDAAARVEIVEALTFDHRLRT